MQQQPDDGGMYMPTRVTYDGKRMRSKPINRKTVDFNSPVINHLLVRILSPFSLLIFLRAVNTLETTGTFHFSDQLMLLNKMYFFSFYFSKTGNTFQNFQFFFSLSCVFTVFVATLFPFAPLFFLCFVCYFHLLT